MRVLIADDEKTLVSMLRELLKGQHIDCDTVYNGADAVDFACSFNYDLIILDIMMPKLNGMEAIKQIRKKNISTPILLLSARAEVSDRVSGLNLGADDYLTKPFNTDELIARIKALTRRRAEFVKDELLFKDLTLDKNTLLLRCGRQAVKLSATEYKIMELLISNPKIIIQKERLIERVWGYDSDAEYNNAEVYVSFLRKKLLLLNSCVGIRATRGVGYSLAGDAND